jgi:hypothetical protein
MFSSSADGSLAGSVPLYRPFPASARLPALAPADLDDESAWRRLGFTPGRAATPVRHLFGALTGFRRFCRAPSTDWVELLRFVNVRAAGFPLTTSAAFALADDPRAPDWPERAATLLIAARELHAELNAGGLQLAPDQPPSELGQLGNVFGTSVVPESGGWRIARAPRGAGTRVAILANQRTFRAVLTDVPLEAGAVSRALRDLAAAPAQGCPAPALATAAREGTRHAIWRRLSARPINRRSFGVMESCDVTVCLDHDRFPASAAEAAGIAQAGNVSNRWYNAALQIVVFGNGRVALLFNYCACLDGNAMTLAAEELYRRALSVQTATTSGAGRAQVRVERLHWEVGERELEPAAADVATVRDTQLHSVFDVPELNRAASPLHDHAVPALMTATDMAAALLLRRHVNIHQFLSLDRFQCLGLVVANVTTPQVRRFVDYVGRQSAPDRLTARQLAREAFASQQVTCRQARAALPLDLMWSLYVATRRGAARRRLIGALRRTRRVLDALGSLETVRRDVLVSHPRLSPAVELVGRPGVRLPYVDCFAYHYRIGERSTQLVVARGPQWQLSSADLVQTLRAQLRLLAAIVA